MKILFVHQNFPGQYKHLAPFFAADPGNQVVSIGEKRDNRRVAMKGLRYLTYEKPRGPGAKTHRYLHRLEAAVRRGQAVARLALRLRGEGFVPDIICAHPGWGESLYLKEVFPGSCLLNYYEFYYHLHGADVGFDPEYPADPEDRFNIPTRNATHLLSLAAADWGISPTSWQRGLFPPAFRGTISVIHDGIDTRGVRPDAAVTLALDGLPRALTRADEVLTYVARNLEPYRGFHVFMRALPEILRQRPNARVLIVGGDEVSYGRRLEGGQTYRERLLAETGSDLDMRRVHFLGRLPYGAYLEVLQVSRVHVYLTVPFVLSWSMLEAMSAGCLLVASRTAPVEEVVQDGVNGLLVDFLSPGELAARVVDALANAQAYEQLRREARRTVVQRYDLRTVCMPQLIGLIGTLAAGRMPGLS